MWGQPVEDYPSIFGEHFSCFENNIGDKLQEEIGRDYFEELLQAYQKEFEISKKEQAMKNPLIINKILYKARDDGHTSQSLESIVKKIVELRNKCV